MRNSFWAYLIAIVVGGISLFVKAALPEQPWLAPALFYLAIVIALLASLGLAHHTALWSRIVARTPRSRLTDGTKRVDGKTANAAARVQVPSLRDRLGQYRCCRSSPRMWPAIPPQRCEDKARTDDTEAATYDKVCCLMTRRLLSHQPFSAVTIHTDPPSETLSPCWTDSRAVRIERVTASTKEAG